MRRHKITKIPLHFKREQNLLIYGGSHLPWPRHSDVLYNLTSPGFNGLLTAQLVNEEGEDVFFFSKFEQKPTKNFFCHSYRSNFISQANSFYVTARSSIEENILGKLLPSFEELGNATQNATKMQNCFQVKIQLFNTKILSILPSKPAVGLEDLSTVRRELNQIIYMSEILLKEIKDVRKLIL